MRLLVVTFLSSLACSSCLATALNVTLVAGPTFAVPCDYTGNGRGFAIAAFEIDNPHSAGLVLLGITLTAIGSGDDATAFSEIGLYLDANGNGGFDPNIDRRYGQAYTAYPADDGSLVFTEILGFAPGESRRFIIVGKLGGSVLPDYQDGFRTIVSAINATGASATGVPTAFTEAAVAMRIPTPLRLEYEVTGGAPYNYVFRLILDNHDGSWSAGQAWRGVLVFGQAAYEQGGTAPFAGWATNPASYPIGPFISTGWSSVALYIVNYDAPSLGNPTQNWQPAFVGDQLTWWGTANVFLNEGEMTWTMYRTGGSASTPGSATLEPAHRVGDYLRVVPVAATAIEALPTETGGGDGFAIGAFDVISHTSSATLSSITIDASGTGDDSTAFSDIRLFVDANGNGAYDPGVDVQFGGSFTAYPVDDGSLTFNGTLNFNPNETKRVFVVARLNGSTLATFGQTFNTTVTAISATGFMHSGLPTAVMPGIHIQAPTLTLATTGYAAVVPANAQGPGGVGVAVAEFLLSNNTVGVANLASITVDAAGAVFDQADFSFVALYEDTNGSGVYDAGDVGATLGSPAAAFPGDDGALTFTQAIPFAPGQTRLFFLVVKLSGTAATGADFWCRVTALGVSGGTETSGVPGTLVHAFTATAPTGGGGGSGDDDSSSCSTADMRNLWLLLLLCGIGLLVAARLHLTP